MLRTILPLTVIASLLAPAASGAAEVSRSVQGADLRLTTPDACTQGGSILEALLQVKLKKSAKYRVRYVAWHLDGRKFAVRYSKPYDLRLATSSLEEGRTYKLEARVYTEFAQKTPKARISTSVSVCPPAALPA